MTLTHIAEHANKASPGLTSEKARSGTTRPEDPTVGAMLAPPSAAPAVACAAIDSSIDRCTSSAIEGGTVQ